MLRSFLRIPCVDSMGDKPAEVSAPASRITIKLDSKSFWRRVKALYDSWQVWNISQTNFLWFEFKHVLLWWVVALYFSPMIHNCLCYEQKKHGLCENWLVMLWMDEWDTINKSYIYDLWTCQCCFALFIVTKQQPTRLTYKQHHKYKQTQNLHISCRRKMSIYGRVQMH